MGNALGGKDRKAAKVMKISGETIKFKPPVAAGDVLKDHPGLVLLESESVKHYGIRAKPLEAHERLQPRRLYFLVELPKDHGVPRRVRSGISMGAKDRLESLMLARRSASDLSIMAKPAMPGSSDGDAGSRVAAQGKGKEVAGTGSGLRVRVRLPKGEVERLMKESRDEADAAEKIMRLYINATDNNHDYKNYDGDDDSVRKIEGGKSNNLMEQKQLHCNGSNGRRREGLKKHEKRVSFLAVREGPVQIAVAS